MGVMVQYCLQVCKMFPNTLVFITFGLQSKGKRSNKQINEVLAVGEQAIAEHLDQLGTWAGGAGNQFAVRRLVEISIKNHHVHVVVSLVSQLIIDTHVSIKTYLCPTS